MRRSARSLAQAINQHAERQAAGALPSKLHAAVKRVARRARGVLDHVRGLTHELMQDLEHACIAGDEVMEQYNKVHHQAGAAVAPFVFVSAMGLEHALPDWRDLKFRETHVQEATPGSYVV